MNITQVEAKQVASAKCRKIRGSHVTIAFRSAPDRLKIQVCSDWLKHAARAFTRAPF